MTLEIFDSEIVKIKRKRAESLGLETFLYDRIQQELDERLSLIQRPFPNRKILSLFESVDLIEMQDLIISNCDLQFVNDVPTFLKTIRESLNPDGLFLASLIGGESLKELHASFALAESEITGRVSPHIHPFIDLKTMGSLMQQARFNLPVIDHEKITVRYASPLKLFHDLRKMGATNSLKARSKTFLRKDVLAKTLENYVTNFSENGKIIANFEVIYVSGWAHHASQQKPLKRGSATHSLQEAIAAIKVPAKKE